MKNDSHVPQESYFVNVGRVIQSDMTELHDLRRLHLGLPQMSPQDVSTDHPTPKPQPQISLAALDKAVIVIWPATVSWLAALMGMMVLMIMKLTSYMCIAKTALNVV